MCDIVIGADRGEFLKLCIVGRSHPDCDDFWDANWLSASVHVRVGGFRGAIDGDIRVDELAAFCRKLASLYESLEGVADFDTLEGWLSIRATGDGLGHITFRCFVLDQPGIGNKLEFTLASDQTFVKQTVNQLREAVKAFPIIGQA